MKNENDVKLQWESDQEYEYRLFINEIVLKGIAPVLAEVEKVSLNLNSKTDNLIEALKPELKKLDYVTIPRKYVKVHNLIRECIEAYKKGIEFIIQGKADNKNDANLIYKAGRYITEGNYWMGIAKIRMWEVMENAG